MCRRTCRSDHPSGAERPTFRERLAHCATEPQERGRITDAAGVHSEPTCGQLFRTCDTGAKSYLDSNRSNFVLMAEMPW